jgi:hypothetical protein
MPALRIGGFLLFLLLAGCAGAGRAPPRGDVAAEPADRSTGRTVAKPPAKVSGPPVAAEPAREKEKAAAGSGKPPPLDLAALEKRLRETRAIGAFTKIALKNQVDDLLDLFRAYYQGRTKTTLAELRQPYELLLLKVLSLLQDSDPVLASTIVASREAIWGILADPAKFATI